MMFSMFGGKKPVGEQITRLADDLDVATKKRDELNSGTGEARSGKVSPKAKQQAIGALKKKIDQKSDDILEKLDAYIAEHRFELAQEFPEVATSVIRFECLKRILLTGSRDQGADQDQALERARAIAVTVGAGALAELSTETDPLSKYLTENNIADKLLDTRSMYIDIQRKLDRELTKRFMNRPLGDLSKPRDIKLEKLNDFIYAVDKICDRGQAHGHIRDRNDRMKHGEDLRDAFAVIHECINSGFINAKAEGHVTEGITIKELEKCMQLCSQVPKKKRLA